MSDQLIRLRAALDQIEAHARPRVKRLTLPSSAVEALKLLVPTAQPGQVASFRGVDICEEKYMPEQTMFVEYADGSRAIVNYAPADLASVEAFIEMTMRRKP